MRTAKTNSASKPNKPKPEHTPNKVGKAFATAGRVLAGSFLVLVISGCIVLSVLTVYVLNLINTESEYDLRRLELNYTTIIYAMDENDEPYELQRLHSEENRQGGEPQLIGEKIVAYLGQIGRASCRERV